MTLGKNGTFVETVPKFKTLGYFLVGLFICLYLPLVLVPLFPILVWRWLVCTIIAPRYRPEIGNAVTVNGQTFAVEFLASNPIFRPRSTIVSSLVMKGTMTKQELKDVVGRRWIRAKCDSSGSEELQYPELQQYIEEWMGFMFWKQDKTFDLDNHIYMHEIKEGMTPMESKLFVDNLMGVLTSQRYPPGRSPWDLHMVSNYKNPELLPGDAGTVIIVRTHHAIGDGVAIVSLVLELTSNFGLRSTAQPLKSNIKNDSVMNLAKFPFSLIHDLGYSVFLMLKPMTHWHCPDKVKTWRQVYRYFPIVSKEKIRLIRKKFDCSTTSVLLSCISAGASYAFSGRETVKSLPCGIPLQGSGHSGKLRNHSTGTLIELIIDSSLEPLERLSRTEMSFKAAKQRSFPFLVTFGQTVASFPFATLVRHLVKNRAISTGLSSFPGPSAPVSVEGRKVLSVCFTTGGLSGVTGVVFTAFGYVDHFAITVSAEAAVMSETEIDKLVKVAEKEINFLYQSALKIL